MLEVSEKTLEGFADSFLNNMLFGDLPTDQLEGLKTFLAEYLKKLYQDRPSEIIKLIDQVDTINPFMIKLALGYGILEDDVVDLTKILFMKINEFFYKKGSFDVLKHISKILEYYGITSYIKKVIYDKQTNSWVLEDVFDSSREPTDIEEFLTPGHLVTKENYASNTFVNNYDTIVIYIRMELNAKVDDRMQHPVALLHAYAISKHKDDILQFYINGNAYDLTLKDFLFFLQYFYLKYIKLRNSDFELDESGLEMWSLFITDPDDIEVAVGLLQSLLAGEFNNRDGIAYFLRVSTRLLNKYKIKTNPHTLGEISVRAHSINDQLATDIDSLGTSDGYVKNLSITLLYVEVYLNKLSADTQLDEAVKNTIRYLINFVVFSINKDSDDITKNLILKFKKYFLPIYTQFFYEIIKTFKIRDEFYRIYTEEIYKIFLKTSSSSSIETQDKQELEIKLTQEDFNKISDSIHTLLRINLNDNFDISDKLLVVVDTSKSSLVKIHDLQFSSFTKFQKDKIDIIDLSSTAMKSTFTDNLEFDDKMKLVLETSDSGVIKLHDRQYIDIDMWQRDSFKMADAAAITSTMVYKENLEFDDKMKLVLETSGSSVIKMHDRQYIDIDMWQRDSFKMTDAAAITSTMVYKENLEFDDKMKLVLETSSSSVVKTHDRQITNIELSRLDNVEISDVMNNIIQSLPKEMLNVHDGWVANLYLVFNSIIKLNDSNTAITIQNQFDQTKILDSVTITVNRSIAKDD